MGLFSSFDISASGMTAERLRYDTISQNLANIDTTRSADGTPYVRKTVMFQEKQNMDFDSLLMTTIGQVGNGVKVTSIVEDTSTAMKKVYDPSHPDADENGYVLYPNVNTITEMTNLIDASRAYEANVTAFNGSKSMVMTALDMGK
ncbi:MAG: flagellar basal body rod protein FlgC [Lachnospiraceae bacterium]|nr:flagellar basal body rod protein FlgC [Lachnospiraceae bacterium]MDE6232023.1 flagellar basal body rod protein FlgC [Lachnospiraceae bacterium]MDE6253722.1 flagellar basal body rod protein FlgC [Lachnospiraceae bacterium]